MTAPQVDRYVLIWESGLCRHGCGEPLARPTNQFINGHGSKLLDILVDAARDGSLIALRRPTAFALDELAPRAWAVESFTPRGLAWYDWLAAHEPGQRPTAEQIDAVLAAMPDDSVEEVLTAPRPGLVPVTVRTPDLADWPAQVEFTEVADTSGAPRPRFDSQGLQEDLATVRQIVGQADAGELDRLEQQVSALAQDNEGLELDNRDLQARVDALTDRLNSAETTVSFDQSGLAELRDDLALLALRERALASARVFSNANYRPLSGEVWDLLRIFRSSSDPVVVRAARALLGQTGME